MNTVKQSASEPCFRFQRKHKFSANHKLLTHRSENFSHPRPLPAFDIWQRKPPDFTPKLYRSLSLPRKSTEDKNSLKKADSYEKNNKLEKLINTKLPTAEESSQFETRFKHIGPYEAKIMFVKTGQYPKGIFYDPKPHDFRQYETNIPDFVASYERDPFNLKFRSQHLTDVHGFYYTKDIQQKDTSAGRYITYKPAEPKWESKLILPKEPWPPKSASYTRYRRRQNVYSAFMDRVNEKLTKIWQEDSSLKTKQKHKLEAI